MSPAALVCAALAFAPGAFAATVTGLYEATVPLADRSERGQAEAFQAAMRQVLVRVTGRRDAGEDPSLAPLVDHARRYVQQFRVVGGDQLFAGFDGVRLERAIVESGQPVWGHERPATLVVLVDESGRRTLQGSDSALRAAFARGAALRGLPVMWPDPSRPVDLADATAPDRVQSIAQAYGADAVLVGRTSAGGQAHWTLFHGMGPTEWRGSAEEGAHGAADAFARVFSGAGVPGGVDVSITVAGIRDLRDYASVLQYLESLTLISGLAVDQLAGDTVVFRANVQGDAERLARAIALGQQLEPVAADATGSLNFRYRH